MYASPDLLPDLALQDAELVAPRLEIVDLAQYIFLAEHGLVRPDDAVANVLERLDVRENVGLRDDGCAGRVGPTAVDSKVS